VNPLEHKQDNEEDKPRKDWNTPVKIEEESHQESAMETEKEMQKAGQGSNDLDDIGVSSLAHAVKSLDQKQERANRRFASRH